MSECDLELEGIGESSIFNRIRRDVVLTRKVKDLFIMKE
jgi:hypothetical protein